MRKSLLLLLPVLGAATIFACEEDGSSSGGTFELDASSGGLDAPVTTPPTDAPPGTDAPTTPPDSGPPPSAPVVVAVSTVDGLPSAGVDVVFNDAAGAVLATGKTGADGKATSPAGMPIAMASALLGTATSNDRHVVSWAGVKAGDTLATSNIADDDPLLGSYDVTWAAGPLGRLGSYTALVGDRCQASKGSAVAGAINVQIAKSCVRAGATNNVLVRANDGTSNIQYAFAKMVAPPSGQTPVVVTAGAFAATGTFSVTATNRPANYQGYTEIDEIAGAQAMSSGQFGYFSRTATLGFTGLAPAFVDGYQTITDGQVGQSSVLLIKRHAVGATGTVDLGTLLPEITDVQIPKVADYKRTKIQWTSAAPLTATDGGAVTIRWSAANESRHGWTVLVAPGATDVTLPALPASAAAWLPPDPGDSGRLPFFAPPDVIFFESDLVPTADAFRSQGARLVPFQDYGVRAIVMPAAGTLRVVRYQPQQA